MQSFQKETDKGNFTVNIGHPPDALAKYICFWGEFEKGGRLRFRPWVPTLMKQCAGKG